MGYTKPTSCTAEDLSAVQYPNHGKTYTVIRHKFLIDAARSILKTHGFNIKNEEYREDFETMSQLIEYKSLKTDDFGAIKFDTKNPHILEFDIDEKDRGFTQNMVGGQIIIPDLFKVDGDEDTDNSDIVLDDDDDSPYLQGLLDEGAASDFFTDGISNKELIDIMLNDPDPNERQIADGALQERGRGRGEF